MTTRTVMALIGIGAMGLGGCGGGETPEPAKAPAAEAAAASTFDSCALLTAEEVQATLGWAVAKSTPYGSGDQGHCVYEGEKSNTVFPIEQAEAGVIACFTNFPCPGDMPGSFGSSADLAAFRKQLYQSAGATAAALEPTIEPIQGLGSPAIMHELAGQYSVEVWLGPRRTAYVSVWTSAEAALALMEKVVARVR